MKDRLIELIDKVLVKYDRGCLPFVMNEIADHLLANGVIVPPCKIGDTVWEINTDNPFDEDLRVMEAKVERFFIGTSVDLHCMDSFGKNVFLTKDEAEQALKELGK